jgi:hypothetical protein
VVGGAHNEAYVVLLTMLGVLAWLGGRPGTGGALATLAAGLKASAALPVAFLAAAGGGAAGGAAVAGAAGAGPEGAAGVAPEGVGPGAAAAGRRRRVLGGVAAGCAAIVAAAYAGFGGDALDALGLLSDNQERTSRWSFPYKTAELLGALLPGDRLDYRDPVRTAYALAFALVAAWLLLKTFRGADPIRMAGWTTVALLVASAWLVPWYVLWLLPLAALAADRRLSLASAALCAWMLVIAVPL